MIRQTQINLTAAGTNGSAIASGTTGKPLNGILMAIHVDHPAAGGAATTDLSVACGSPALTLMAKADSVADAWFHPVAQKTGADGAAVSGEYGELPLHGYVTASLAQANDGQTCAVTLLWDDMQ